MAQRSRQRLPHWLPRDDQSHRQPLRKPQPATWCGHLHWITCPRCDRRAAIFYRLSNDFACRHCHDLRYACQKEGPGDRAIQQADKIRERLRWVPGIAHGHGGKPHGMHWTTFCRLMAEHDALVEVGYSDIAAPAGLPPSHAGSLNLFRKMPVRPTKSDRFKLRPIVGPIKISPGKNNAHRRSWQCPR